MVSYHDKAYLVEHVHVPRKSTFTSAYMTGDNEHQDRLVVHYEQLEPELIGVDSGRYDQQLLSQEVTEPEYQHRPSLYVVCLVKLAIRLMQFSETVPFLVHEPNGGEGEYEEDRAQSDRQYRVDKGPLLVKLEVKISEIDEAAD